MDKCILQIERSQDTKSSADSQTVETVKTLIKHKIFVTPEVEIVDYGSLPEKFF